MSDDKSKLPPVHVLMLEIIDRCDRIEGKNLIELTQDLVSHFGSPERAISALRWGDAGLEWMSDTLN
jgi:hypothetical protein